MLANENVKFKLLLFFFFAYKNNNNKRGACISDVWQAAYLHAHTCLFFLLLISRDEHICQAGRRQSPYPGQVETVEFIIVGFSDQFFFFFLLRRAESPDHRRGFYPFVVVSTTNYIIFYIYIYEHFRSPPVRSAYYISEIGTRLNGSAVPSSGINTRRSNNTVFFSLSLPLIHFLSHSVPYYPWLSQSHRIPGDAFKNDREFRLFRRGTAVAWIDDTPVGIW